ncbi:MAG: DNA gyrase inhibitor YacG [Alphaproteobacteria bacterium]|nr:DNA gyrase inhibitor YacG [Alphaproteobacteria bacterium]
MATAKTKAACPVCGKPVTKAARPFCSKACADRDLGKWLGGEYRIPTEEQPEVIEGPEREEEERD